MIDRQAFSQLTEMEKAAVEKYFRLTQQSPSQEQHQNPRSGSVRQGYKAPGMTLTQQKEDTDE